jgi:nucleoside 2-deoxyribosyltransferase
LVVAGTEVAEVRDERDRRSKATQAFRAGVLGALQEGRAPAGERHAAPLGRRPRSGAAGGGSRLYVASPLGFNEPGRHWADEVLHPRLQGAGWEVLDPWLDQDGGVAAAVALPPGPARVEALREVSRSIGARNRALLADADAVLAVLDGPDVDSGTAAEIGWAAAHGTPVVGLRTDFRLADHEAAIVNLQVEDFVVASGGRLVTSLDDALKALASLPA